MGRKADKIADPKDPNGRENRLKAALKANLARRKAQAKARKGSDGQKES